MITVVCTACAWWVALNEAPGAEAALEATGVQYGMFRAFSLFAAATESAGIALLLLGGLRRLCGCYEINTDH